MFNVLQRRVFGFLDARSLVCAGQASKGMQALSAEPPLWRALWTRTPLLRDFIKVEDVESGAHLLLKLSKVAPT